MSVYRILTPVTSLRIISTPLLASGRCIKLTADFLERLIRYIIILNDTIIPWEDPI